MKNSFKKAVFTAKNEEQLTSHLLQYWQTLKAGDVIDLDSLGDKPKYKAKINEILQREYQNNKIFAIWSQDETKIRKTFV